MTIRTVAFLLFVRLIVLELQTETLPAVEAPSAASTTILPSALTLSSFVAMAANADAGAASTAVGTASTTFPLVTSATDPTFPLLLPTTALISAGETNAVVLVPAPIPAPTDAAPVQAAAPAPAAAPEPANPATLTLTMSTTVSTVDPSVSLSLSTLWVPVTLADGSTTWVQSIFTQSFAAVPDQLAPPGSGRIGLGTLTATVRRDGEQTAVAAMGACVGWKKAVVAVGIVGAAMQ